jgi:hypothetical protein
MGFIIWALITKSYLLSLTQYADYFDRDCYFTSLAPRAQVIRSKKWGVTKKKKQTKDKTLSALEMMECEFSKIFT